MSNLPSHSTPKRTYSQMTQQMQYPTKEQAIVLDAIEGISVHEYALEIGKLIDPINIRFISRISHGRVCLYLSSQEIANRLTDAGTKVNIGSHRLEIRPLVSKAKRIIISNVCPIITNEFVYEEISKLNIKPASQVSFIRAGIPYAGHAHIMSFRRQIYIQPEDIEKLPPTMTINYDNTDYWIYLSKERLSCFLCKEEGHIAKHCKNITDTQVNNTFEEEKENNSTLEQMQTHSEELDIAIGGGSEVADAANLTPVPENDEFIVPRQSSKRYASRSLSTVSSKTASDKNIKQLEPPATEYAKKNGSKKSKISQESISPKDVMAQLAPAIPIIQGQLDSSHISADKLAEFLSETYSQSNVHEIALKYTESIAQLANLLAEVRKNVTDTNLKYRINRINKRLANYDNENSSSDTASNCGDNN